MSSSAETVTITIPCKPEYVGVVRLALLGIASRLPFSYDEVEDLRLAVGEACTHAVERAGSIAATIQVVARITGPELAIEVTDTVPQGSPKKSSSDDSALLAEAGVDQEGLGILLMEILVDKIQIIPGPDGTTVRLTKVAPH
jgi:serine/threonine-protein kinase RsbW